MSKEIYKKNNWLTTYDIFLLQPFLEEIPRKTAIELRKHLGLSRTILKEEVRIAVKIFTEFFKLMTIDIINNHCQFKYSKLKMIRLKRVTHAPIIQKMCRKEMLLPSMPIHALTLIDHKNGMTLQKKIILKNELGKLLSDQNRNGTSTEGVREFKQIDDYLDILDEQYPGLGKKMLSKIISHGVKHLFFPMVKKHVMLKLVEYHQTPKDVQVITNEEVYSRGYNNHQLMQFVGNFKNAKYYALLTDKQQMEANFGKDVYQHCVLGLNLVKLFQRKKKLKFKNVYEISDTRSHSYSFTTVRRNVEASRLKYVYRRVNHRLKPIDHTEQYLD